MKIFQTDAFTDEIFKGNPAAIVPLDSWIDDDLMQNIAIENNLSETAFFVQNGDGSYQIRWFTPQTEVNLCGHATLASAHVLYEHLGFQGEQVIFQSKSGELRVKKQNGQYWMDFPARLPEPIPVPKLLPEAIGVIPIYTGVNIDLLVLVDSEAVVRALKPDLIILKRMEVRGVIVTAASPGKEYDFVCRFFAPAVGIPEDSVTGSAHAILTPFWAKRLGKKKLVSRQVSKRGGTLHCTDNGSRVEIGGNAVTYLTGEILI